MPAKRQQFHFKNTSLSTKLRVMLWVALQKSIYRSKHVKWKKSSYHKQPQVTLNIVRTCTICFFRSTMSAKSYVAISMYSSHFILTSTLFYEKEHKANTIRSIGFRFPGYTAYCMAFKQT